MSNCLLLWFPALPLGGYGVWFGCETEGRGRGRGRRSPRGGLHHRWDVSWLDPQPWPSRVPKGQIGFWINVEYRRWSRSIFSNKFSLISSLNTWMVSLKGVEHADWRGPWDFGTPGCQGVGSKGPEGSWASDSCPAVTRGPSDLVGVNRDWIRVSDLSPTSSPDTRFYVCSCDSPRLCWGYWPDVSIVCSTVELTSVGSFRRTLVLWWEAVSSCTRLWFPCGQRFLYFIFELITL